MGIIVFFLQAEDGIRDESLTGVQTCALPISPPYRTGPPLRDPALERVAHAHDVAGRSEERRVGKECRSRWSPDPSKTQKGPRAALSRWAPAPPPAASRRTHPRPP